LMQRVLPTTHTLFTYRTITYHHTAKGEFGVTV
jgi:hypothetical protein